MKKVRYIKYKDKKVLYIDFSNANKKDEMIKIMKEAQKEIFASPPDSLLTISNFADCVVDYSLTYELKQYISQNKPYIKAAAILGIGGIKRVILNTVMQITQRKFYVFNNLKDALEWIIKQ